MYSFKLTGFYCFIKPKNMHLYIDIFTDLKPKVTRSGHNNFLVKNKDKDTLEKIRNHFLEMNGQMVWPEPDVPIKFAVGKKSTCTNNDARKECNTSTMNFKIIRQYFNISP
uniref:Uncharacterized protein n=1 Tax=Strongyloides papillosus TaxID=174720 RepID=A0A0N5C9L8_STREA